MVVLAEVKLNTLPALGPPSVRPAVMTSSRRRVTNQDRSQVIELYESGASTRVIASRLDVGKTTVLNILHQAGVKLRPRGRQKN